MAGGGERVVTKQVRVVMVPGSMEVWRCGGGYGSMEAWKEGEGSERVRVAVVRTVGRNCAVSGQ